jgi:hypothetical protein
MTAASALKLAVYIGIGAELDREMPRKKEGI